MGEQSDTPETDAAEREDAGPITHAIRGWNYARKHERERDEALDVLRRNGFVLCDIAACNCGSWHARYGIPERMAEIKDALTELRDQHKAFTHWYFGLRGINEANFSPEDLAWAAWKAALAQPETEAQT